jgi:hypothetical protein
MEVIGIGFGRTGTKSLQTALDIIGYNTFHTTEMFNSQSIFDMMYEEVFSAQSASLKVPDFRMLEKEGYNATTDFPFSLYYRELRELYPEAKFILTAKSQATDWARSWIFLIDHITWLERALAWRPGIHRIGAYNRWLMALLHQDDTFLTDPYPITQDPDKLVRAYEAHNAAVRDFFGQQQQQQDGKVLFLDYHVKQGWEPLCDFLGKPIPSQPFPHVNSAKDLRFEVGVYVFLNYATVVFSLFILYKLVGKCWRMKSDTGASKTKTS